MCPKLGTIAVASESCSEASELSILWWTVYSEVRSRRVSKVDVIRSHRLARRLLRFQRYALLMFGALIKNGLFLCAGISHALRETPVKRKCAQEWTESLPDFCLTLSHSLINLILRHLFKFNWFNCLLLRLLWKFIDSCRSRAGS
jgi:hypothetical protein